MPARGEPGLPLPAIFAGVALILLAIAPQSAPGFDGSAFYAVTDGLIHGTLHVPCTYGVPARGGCVSAYYPLLSFVLVPFALVGRALGTLAGLPLRAMGERVAVAVPALCTAGAATFCAALAGRLGAGRRRALAAGVVFALGTEALTYSRTLFAEPLGALCLAGAAWGMLCGHRRVGLAACALAVLAKPQLGPAVLAIAVALAIHDRRPRPALDVLGGLAVGVGLYLLYNRVRVGDQLDFSRPAGQLASGTHDPAALGLVKQLGVLLVSPNYGVLWYSPAVVVGAVGLWRARRDRAAAVCLAAAAGVLLIYLPAPYGQAWGTRYLVPAMPLLCAGIALLGRRAFRLALVLAALTLVGQLPNVGANFERYLYARPTDAWSLHRVQLVGVWPSAVAQVRFALENPPVGLVDGLAYTARGREITFQSVALWWWPLRAAGRVPALLGALLSLAMILGGVGLLRRVWRGAGVGQRG